MHIIRILLLTIVLAIPSTSAEAKTKLTPEEVSTIFIGTPFHGPSGAFLFRRDGTYTYKDFSSGKQNTWSYEMNSDGSISGATTVYTFFRRNNGSYFYHHGRTNKNFKAIPNRPSNFD